MFGLFKKKQKHHLSDADQEKVVAAIKAAEMKTSGEIRVFVESRCSYIDAMDRARELFFQLKMNETKNHNAVIVYVAITDKQVALFGDEGIYKKTGGDPYWIHILKSTRKYFSQGRIGDGIANAVEEIGHSLASHFPYDPNSDKNELPDDIVFGI